MTQYVTPKEASSLLQVTAKTLREWDKQGKIGVIRTPGGTSGPYGAMCSLQPICRTLRAGPIFCKACLDL